MPRTSNNNDPVRRELEEVGRSRRSLAVDALIECKSLLQCRRVVTGTVVNAVRLQLAESAKQAILAAIREIHDRTDKRIAEAVLCSTQPFIGKTVNGRKYILESEGISPDAYKERRGPILDFIVSFLEVNAQPALRTTASPLSQEDHASDSQTAFIGANELPDNLRRCLVPTADRELTYPEPLEPLISYFADLHYATLSYLFVTNLNRSPGIVETPDWDYVSGSAKSVRFGYNVLSLVIHKSLPPHCNVDSPAMLWAAMHLPAPQYRELCFMITTLPMSGECHAQYMASSFLADAYEETEGYTPENGNEVNVVVAEHFGISDDATQVNPASRRASSFTSFRPLSRISVLAAKSVAVLNILGVASEAPILRTRRDSFLEQIRELYAFYEHERFMRGYHYRIITNLRFTATVVAAAARYFGAASDIFAKSPAIWVNYSADEQELLHWDPVKDYPQIKPAT